MFSDKKSLNSLIFKLIHEELILFTNNTFTMYNFEDI